jgi:hypothetical protein
VTVQYREEGSSLWKEGMPLFRVPAGENVGFTWSNKHSGSIFGLKPDTGYEILLSLTDPDGGSAQRTVTARTRPVPEVTDSAEIIEINPGSYGTLETKNGTSDRPVVYRCSGGEAVFTHINLIDRRWVYIEGLRVKNMEDRGRGIRMNRAENCVVRGCVIEAASGIVAYLSSANNYISGNVVTGTSKWTNEAMGAGGDNYGMGIEMTGPGNVICYNRVTGFRDCISLLEDQHVFEQTCIDIHNNDVFTGVDDGIEADFCFSNCRIYNNRITNCFVGLSSQPGLGGPNYFFRNVMYNLTHGAFKLKRFSQGDVVMHNTVVKVGDGLGGNSRMDFAWFRNNLAIGGPDGGVKWGGYGAGPPYAANILDPGVHSSFDYDAVGAHEVPYVARIGSRTFSEVEKNGVERITMEETFNNVEFPNPPVPERDVPDLRPRKGARVINAGVRIPNINDDFTGTAPDIGAYEYGQELPHYGPVNEPVTSVNEPDTSGNKPEMVLYPNPATDYVYVKFREKPIGDHTLEIFNLSGKMVRTEIIKGGESNYRFNTSGMSGGVYIFKAMHNRNIIGASRLMIMK